MYICDLVIKLPKKCTQIPFRGTFVSLYQHFFFPSPPPHTGMASAEVYAAAIAYFEKHRETEGMSLRKVAGVTDLFPLITRSALQNRFNGRVLMDAKAGAPRKVTIAQVAELKVDVQNGMHGNAMSVAAVTAKLGAYASSNGLPYKDGVPSKNTLLHFFDDQELGIAKARLLRTGRMEKYDWKKLEPAYSKLGSVFEEHPILLKEPRRIANMDEKPLSAASEKIGNGKEKVVYDKSVDFVPSMVTQSLTSDVPHVTFVPTVLGDGTKLKNAYVLKVGAEGSEFQARWLKPPFLPGFDAAWFAALFFAVTLSGYMTLELFKLLMMSFIIPQWRILIPDGPLLLILDFPDFHHLCKELTMFLLTQGVMLWTLPHESSTLTQSLDVVAFGLLQKMLNHYYQLLAGISGDSYAYLAKDMKKNKIARRNMTVEEHGKKTSHQLSASIRALGLDNKLDQRTHLFLTEQAWSEITAEDIQLGFTKVGTIPFNPLQVQKRIELRSAQKKVNKEIAPKVLFRQVEEKWLGEIGAILSSKSDSHESKILKIVQMSKTAPDEKKFYASNPGKTSACPPCTTM